MNLIQEMRLRGLFSKPKKNPFDLDNTVDFQDEPIFKRPNINVPINTLPPSGTPDTGMFSLKKSLTPETDAFKEYLRSQPNRQDHQLNKLGKALALAAGVAEGSQRGVSHGINTGMGLMSRPYEEASEEWAAKGGRLKELAGIEQGERAFTREGEKEQRKYELDVAKEIREWTAMGSRMGLNEAQIKKIEEDIKTGAAQYVKGDDGFMHRIDKATGVMSKLDKIGETPEEKREFDFDLWWKKEQKEQEGRKELIGLNQVNDLIKLNKGNELAKGLAKYRHDLTASGMSLLDQNRAMENTRLQMQNIYPGLYTQVFDEKGQMRQGLSPETGSLYALTFQDVLNKTLGKQGSAESQIIPGQSKPVTQEGITTAPEDASLTAQAIANIKAGYSPEDAAVLLANPQAIQDEINDIKSSGAPSTNIPEANISSSNMPPVQAPTNAMPSISPEFQHEIGDFNIPQLGARTNIRPELMYPSPGASMNRSPLLGNLTGPNFGKVNPQIRTEFNRTGIPQIVEAMKPNLQARLDVIEAFKASGLPPEAFTDWAQRTYGGKIY